MDKRVRSGTSAFPPESAAYASFMASMAWAIGRARRTSSAFRINMWTSSLGIKKRRGFLLPLRFVRLCSDLFDAQVGLAHHLVLFQILGRIGKDDFACLNDVAAIG